MNPRPMSHEYREYYVRTDNVEQLKRELGSLAAVNAETALIVTGTRRDGEAVTDYPITFRVAETSGEGAFLTRGIILPQGTEATIRNLHSTSGDEYLVLDGDLSDTPEDQTPQP